MQAFIYAFPLLISHKVSELSDVLAFCQFIYDLTVLVSSLEQHLLMLDLVCKWWLSLHTDNCISAVVSSNRSHKEDFSTVHKEKEIV